jgi:hypothetical protein
MITSTSKLKTKLAATLAILFFALFSSYTAFGAVVTITGAKTWNTGSNATYSGNDIVIDRNATLTIDIASASCNSINMGDPTNNGNYSCGLVINTGNTLTITGNLDEVISQLPNGSKFANITLNGTGKLKCAALTGDELVLTSTTSGTIEVTGTNTLPIVLTAYNNLIVSGNTTLGHNISVGSLTINNPGKLTPGLSNTVTSAAGSVSGSGTAVVNRGGTNAFTSQYIFSTYATSALTVEFAGTSAQTTSFASFYNLKINNSFGVSLSGNTAITGTLTLATGKLVLGSNNLTMSSSASVSGGSATSYIQADGAGKVVATVVNNNLVRSFPIGTSTAVLPVNIQIATTSSATAFTLGVNDGVVNSSGTALTTHAVNATWSVTPSASVNNATLTFGWNSALSNYNAIKSFIVSRANTSSSWAAVDPSSIPNGTNVSSSANSISNYTQSTPSKTFSGAALYSVGDATDPFAAAVPLPVELISFNANKVNDAQVRLDWSTAWEINNRGFEIERSTNGVYWTNIGFVEGNGNSNQLLNYTFPTSLAGINSSLVYYRLKQVDFNGKFEYSPVRTVRLNGAVAKVEGIYPNPAMNRISVNLGAVEAGNIAKVIIMDMTGKVIMASEQMIEAGNTALDMNIDNLNRGNYIVNISSATTSYNTKLIKL